MIGGDDGLTVRNAMSLELFSPSGALKSDGVLICCVDLKSNKDIITNMRGAKKLGRRRKSKRTQTRIGLVKERRREECSEVYA